MRFHPCTDPESYRPVTSAPTLFFKPFSGCVRSSHFPQPSTQSIHNSNTDSEHIQAATAQRPPAPYVLARQRHGRARRLRLPRQPPLPAVQRGDAALNPAARPDDGWDGARADAARPHFPPRFAVRADTRRRAAARFTLAVDGERHARRRQRHTRRRLLAELVRPQRGDIHQEAGPPRNKPPRRRPRQALQQFSVRLGERGAVAISRPLRRVVVFAAGALPDPAVAADDRRAEGVRRAAMPAGAVLAPGLARVARGGGRGAQTRATTRDDRRR